jgi:F0F1-type ATP synthase beta subunit
MLSPALEPLAEGSEGSNDKVCVPIYATMAIERQEFLSRFQSSTQIKACEVSSKSYSTKIDVIRNRQIQRVQERPFSLRRGTPRFD